MYTHFSRKGRALRDDTQPELASVVQYGADAKDAPSTFPASRCIDDKSELALGISVAGAVPMLIHAVSDGKACAWTPNALRKSRVWCVR